MLIPQCRTIAYTSIFGKPGRPGTAMRQWLAGPNNVMGNATEVRQAAAALADQFEMAADGRNPQAR
jgi:hypothetical protein